MFPLAGCLLQVTLHEAIPLLRSYQLGKSIGATNIHVPVILMKLSDFIQTTKFRKYPLIFLDVWEHLIHTHIQHPRLIIRIFYRTLLVVGFDIDTLPRLKSWDSTSTRPLADPVLRLSVTAWCPIRESIFTQGSLFELIPYGIY